LTIDASCLSGALVPSPPWTAALAGSFSRAVSLLHPDGAFVSLVRNQADMEARAVHLDIDWNILTRALEPDEGRLCRVIRTEDGFSFQIDQTVTATVRLVQQRVVTVKSELKLAAQYWQAAAFRQRNLVLNELQQYINEEHKAGRPFSGLHDDTVFSRHFRQLQNRPDWPANLVGFGPGTTPAGDDWLGGYLLALDMNGEHWAAAAAQLRMEIQDRLKRTNTAGRTLLLGALAGETPAWLTSLASTLAAQAAGNNAESRYNLPEQVRYALAHGATSGEDTLAGLLAGLTLREA